MLNSINISDVAWQHISSYANRKGEDVSTVVERIIMALPVASAETPSDEMLTIKQQLAKVSPQLADTITGKSYGSDLSEDYRNELAELRQEKYK